MGCQGIGYIPRAERPERRFPRVGDPPGLGPGLARLAGRLDDVGVGTLLQQLPALLGVAIGALATWAVTSSAERAKWHRQQAVRWDEKKLAAYAEYSHAVKQLISTATRLREQRTGSAVGMDSPDAQTATAAAEAALVAAEDERTMKWESVLLLGNSDVIIAARAWHQSAFRLEWMALGRGSDMSWDEAIGAVSQTRRAYYEAAKTDLGIRIGSAPEAYEWQLAKMVAASTEVAPADQSSA